MTASRLREALGQLRTPWIAVPAAACALTALTLSFDAPVVILGLVAGVTLLYLLLHPVAATLITLFVVYANLPVLATRVYGVPTLVAGSAVLLLALPLAHHLVLRRQRLRADRTLALMLLLLAVMTASATLAAEPGLAAARLQAYVLEGIVLYALVVNVVRDLPTFRRAVWTVLATGALLGALGAWQAVSDSYGRQFGGLAHRETEVRISEPADPDAPTEVRVSKRASGPVDEPNRFGQILIVLLPLGVFCYRTAGSRLARIAAAAAGSLVLAGVVLTHSRGAFLVLIALAALALWVRWLRPRHVLSFGLALVLALPFIAPTYRDRIASIGAARDLLDDQPNVEADGAIRGRTTEMLAALHVFIDHPVLGVGPGQYMPVYSVEYQTRPGVAFRDLRRPRRAHSLYLELAAETGVLGLAVFLGIVGLLFRDLARARRGAPRDVSELATALAFALAAYLGTAAFLHLSFERYFWLLLALASAGLHGIRQSEGAPAPAPQRPGPFGHPAPRGPAGPLVPAFGSGSGRWRAGVPAAAGSAARAVPRRAGARGATARTSRGARVALLAQRHARRARAAARAWVAASPGAIRTGTDAALAFAAAAASALNAWVQAIGALGLSVIRRSALLICRAVDGVGALALDQGRRVAAEWPGVTRSVERAGRTSGQAAVRVAGAAAAAVRRVATASASARRRATGSLRPHGSASSHYLFRALDAVITAPVAEDRKESIRGLFLPLRQAHFKRVQTAANVVEARWPRLALHVRRRLLREEALAFSAYGRPELLGYGAGSTVFRMPARSNPAGDVVLKVLRRSLGRPLEHVLEEARHAQACYLRLTTLYAGADLVVPTRFLVLQAPLLGRPAAACIQPCLPGELRDLFELRDDELLALLLEDDVLAAQFRLFVQRTVEGMRRTRSCIDVVGRSNVLVLATPAGPRIRVIDFGVMQLDDLLRERPRVVREVRRRVARLVRLDAALTRRPYASGAGGPRADTSAEAPPVAGVHDQPSLHPEGHHGEVPCPR